MKKTNLILLTTSVILSASAILVSSCKDRGLDKEHKEKIAALRFQTVEHVKFDMFRDGRIMLDKETGIKYLYVPTQHNDGPIFTRLWDK